MIRELPRGPAATAPPPVPPFPLPVVAPSDADEAHTTGELPTHFSYSAMSTFQDCPRKWAYAYLSDAPREFVGASLLMGGSLHVAVECLHHYRQAGFKIAVDDVGGGYASLEAIVETRPEVVKIDRHIISELKHDSFKRSIVKFVVAFCKENRIISVAEGIETKQDLDTVIDLGVDAGQGYFLCRPAPQLNLPEMRKGPLVA